MRIITALLLVVLAVPLHAQVEPAPASAEPTIALPASLIKQLLTPASASTTPLLSIDYTALLQQILAIEQQTGSTNAKLVELETQMLALEQSTNDAVQGLNKSVGQFLTDAAVFIGKYIAPAILAYGTAKGWFK